MQAQGDQKWKPKDAKMQAQGNQKWEPKGTKMRAQIGLAMRDLSGLTCGTFTKDSLHFPPKRAQNELAI